MRICWLLAAPLVFATPAARGVEVGLAYSAVPATVDFVKTPLAGGPREDGSDTAILGTLGLRIVMPLGGALGPFSAAVGTGFGLPAGSQSFDLRRLSTYGGSGTPYTHAQKHEGEFISWNMTAVPLMFLGRYGRPTGSVSLVGEIGVGMLVMGLGTEQTITRFDPSDTTVIAKETSRWQTTALAFAVSAAAGLSVPATESLDLHLSAGVTWVNDVPFATTDTNATPVLTYGATPGEPGLTLGGLGFEVRLALSLNP